MLKLAETQDCLWNVDATGTPVPSARFMGGRDIELLAGIAADAPGDGEVEEATVRRQVELALTLIASGEFTLPALTPGVGPYPNAKKRAATPPADVPHAIALAHLYAAMMADVTLDLIGSRESLFIDGRFGASPVFTRLLAALRAPDDVFVHSGGHGVARGALRLVDERFGYQTPCRKIEPLAVDMKAYRACWRDAAESA
jgi:hypothetical protein